MAEEVAARRTRHAEWRGRVGAALCVLIGAAVTAGVLWPSTDVGARLSTAPVLAHALAFPVLLGAVALVLVAVFVLTFLRSWRWWRTALGVVLVLVSAAVGVHLLWQPMDLPRAGPPRPPTQLLTVISWNTANSLEPGDLALVVDRFDPDVLVLPETTAGDLAAAFRGLTRGGDPWSAFTTQWHGDSTPTSIAVHQRLGEYRVVPGIATASGALTLEPASDSSLPVIVGLHNASPVTPPMSIWRDDVSSAALAAGCAPGPDGRDTIVAGDFNATLRHGALANRPGCRDVLAAVGKGHLGTWPTWLPAWLGTPIDHVLVHGQLRPETGDLVTVGNSDHRVVVASVTQP